MVSKKRYVGDMYESLSQEKSHLDAKGIEMVRRDQCPITVKLQEKVLRLLFETRDLSIVKRYLSINFLDLLFPLVMPFF